MPFKQNILNVRKSLKPIKTKSEGKYGFKDKNHALSSFPSPIVVIDEPQKYMTTTDIFQLPAAFYPAIIESIYFKDTGKMVELEVVAANRNDYEWMKELRAKIGQGKHITFRCFNGDLITINKCTLILCLSP